MGTTDGARTGRRMNALRMLAALFVLFVLFCVAALAWIVGGVVHAIP